MTKKQAKTEFNDQYFDKFKNNGWWGKYILSHIDKKEPVFTKLKNMRPQGSTLLDVGCGNGRFLEHAQNYFKCTGVDPSSAAISQAQNYAPSADFVKGSVYQLSNLKLNQFDIVTCFDALEHLVDYDRAIQEIIQLLKPGGLFIFSVPNGDSIGLQTNLEKWWAFKEPDHMWFFNSSQWHLIMQRYGLVPLKTYFNGLMHPPYIKWLPSIIQTLLIKYPTQALALFGFPLPKWCGEVFFSIMYKHKGFDSENYKMQIEEIEKQ